MRLTEVSVEEGHPGRAWGGSILNWSTFVIPISTGQHYLVAVVKPEQKLVYMFDSLDNKDRGGAVAGKVIR